MKKFMEIIKDIEAVNNEIKVLENKQTTLVDTWCSVEDIKERVNVKKSLDNDIKEVSNQLLNKKITIKILKNNAKIALFNEVTPVIKEVLEKFNNKPYGEKTRTKISNLIHEKSDCRAYIYNEYGNGKITVYPDYGYNAYNIEIGSGGKIGDNKPLLIDNKIQADNFINPKLYFTKDLYIDNIEDHIELLKERYNKAYELQLQLDVACKEFNNIAVGDIEYIHVDNRIYSSFRG